jgi:ABC-type amino acid transport substrate-binding protein
MNKTSQALISVKRVFPRSFAGLLLVCSLAFFVQCNGPPQRESVAIVPPAPLEPISSQILRYAIFPAPPYMIGADDDQTAPTGIDVEIVQKIARSMDLRLEFVRCAWVRCLELVETGKADILSSVYKKPEREEFLFYLNDPYLTELPIAFYYLKGQGYTVNRSRTFKHG